MNGKDLTCLMEKNKISSKYMAELFHVTEEEIILMCNDELSIPYYFNKFFEYKEINWS
jgi:hypothetical protein